MMAASCMTLITQSFRIYRKLYFLQINVSRSVFLGIPYFDTFLNKGHFRPNVHNWRIVENNSVCKDSLITLISGLKIRPLVVRRCL